ARTWQAEGHLGPRVRRLGHRRRCRDRQQAAGHRVDHEPGQGEGDGPGSVDLLPGPGCRRDRLPSRVLAGSGPGEHRPVVPSGGTRMNSPSVRPLRGPGRGKPSKAQSTAAVTPMNGVQVMPVRSTLELDEFIRFQLELYREDPYFVPPIVAER